VNPANGIKTLTRDEEPSVSISFDCVAIKEKKRKKGKKNEKDSIWIMESSSNVSKRKWNLRSHQPKRRESDIEEKKKRCKQHKSTSQNSNFPSVYFLFCF
jgi:hypothetical protein